MKKDVIEADLDKQKQEKEYIEDVAMELELVDEDENVQYKIGEAFVFMKQSEAVEQLERDQQTVEVKIQELEEKNDSIENRMNELKKVLYAKFGDNINLER